MSFKRPTKSDDQDKAERAKNLLVELTEMNPDIDPNQWTAAAFTCIAHSFFDAEVSYEDFCSSMEEMARFYKYVWEE